LAVPEWIQHWSRRHGHWSKKPLANTKKARGILNPKTSNFVHPSCHGDRANKAMFNYMFFQLFIFVYYYFIFLSTSLSAAHVALHQFYMFCSYFTWMVISSFAFSFAGFDRLQPFIHFLWPLFLSFGTNFSLFFFYPFF